MNIPSNTTTLPAISGRSKDPIVAPGAQSCTARKSWLGSDIYTVNIGARLPDGITCNRVLGVLQTSVPYIDNSPGIEGWKCTEDSNGHTKLSFTAGRYLSNEINGALGQVWAGMVNGFNCPDYHRLKARNATAMSSASGGGKTMSAAAWAVAYLALFGVMVAL